MPIIGVDAKAYRNTGVDFETPTWTDLTNLRDVALGLEIEDFDASVRGLAFVQHLPTLFDLEVTANALWVVDDVGLAAILTATWARDYIDLAFVDSDIETAGADGVRAAWGIFTSSRGEALREGLAYEWAFRPYATGDATIVPQRWISV